MITALVPRTFLLIVAAGALMTVSACGDDDDDDDDEQALVHESAYQRELAPLLEPYGCASAGCHGGGAHAGGLNLDSWGGASTVITPCDAEGSVLVHQITSPLSGKVMPPASSSFNSVSNYDVGQIREWIDAGAGGTCE